MSRKQTLLWLKKRNDARQDSQRLARHVDEAVNRVEAETAQLREIEARVEHARESHYSASDALHAAQSEMFAANSEVSRLETEIGHLRDSRARLETRLGQLGAEETHWRMASKANWPRKRRAGTCCWKIPAAGPPPPPRATRKPRPACPVPRMPCRRRAPTSPRPAAA
jgi:hypothetical protein